MCSGHGMDCINVSAPLEKTQTPLIEHLLLIVYWTSTVKKLLIFCLEFEKNTFTLVGFFFPSFRRWTKQGRHWYWQSGEKNKLRWIIHIFYSLADYQLHHLTDFSEHHPMVLFTHDLMQEVFADISEIDCKEAYICISSLLALDK